MNNDTEVIFNSESENDLEFLLTRRQFSRKSGCTLKDKDRLGSILDLAAQITLENMYRTPKQFSHFI